MKGEEAVASGVHENYKLILGLGIMAVRIKSRDDFPVRIINDETISREEHRSCELQGEIKGRKVNHVFNYSMVLAI
ncbi:hypothetical protein D5086_032425 [Populus alba]|uniref:Uncharacterized protein n=1 Tax=Populus alba TaxID=43335 RepID=A0ACC4ALB6_POPAL